MDADLTSEGFEPDDINGGTFKSSDGARHTGALLLAVGAITVGFALVISPFAVSTGFLYIAIIGGLELIMLGAIVAASSLLSAPASRRHITAGALAQAPERPAREEPAEVLVEAVEEEPVDVKVGVPADSIPTSETAWDEASSTGSRGPLIADELEPIAHGAYEPAPPAGAANRGAVVGLTLPARLSAGLGIKIGPRLGRVWVGAILLVAGGIVAYLSLSIFPTGVSKGWLFVVVFIGLELVMVGAIMATSLIISSAVQEQNAPTMPVAVPPAMPAEVPVAAAETHVSEPTEADVSEPAAVPEVAPQGPVAPAEPERVPAEESSADDDVTEEETGDSESVNVEMASEAQEQPASRDGRIDCPYCGTSNAVSPNCASFDCEDCCLPVAVLEGRGVRVL